MWAGLSPQAGNTYSGNLMSKILTHILLGSSSL